jgi:hypothetical protein
MKRVLLRCCLLAALVALATAATAYAVVAGATYTAQPGDTVNTPTANCAVADHAFECNLTRSQKRHVVSATVYPKAIFIEVNGTVRYVCYANGQCLKS